MRQDLSRLEDILRDAALLTDEILSAENNDPNGDPQLVRALAAGLSDLEDLIDAVKSSSQKG